MSIAAIRVIGIEAVRRSKVEIWAGPPACTARPRDGASGRGKLRRVRKGLLAGDQQHRRASFRGLENPTREKRQEGLALRPSGTGSGCCDRRRRSTTRRCWCTACTAGAKLTATRRPVMGSVVTMGSVRMIHPLSQRGSGQGINLARFGQHSLFNSPGRRFGSRANILRAEFRCQSRRFR